MSLRQKRCSLTSFRNYVLYYLVILQVFGLHGIRLNKPFVCRTLPVTTNACTNLHHVRAINPLFSIGQGGGGYTVFPFSLFKNSTISSYLSNDLVTIHSRSSSGARHAVPGGCPTSFRPHLGRSTSRRRKPPANAPWHQSGKLVSAGRLHVSLRGRPAVGA